MEEQACPRCKTTKYRNPSLKLMVNVCGHTLCEACVDLLFLKGSGSCPSCLVPLRRNNFREQLFEDPTVEKEVDIRKRILRDYNKKEEDFETLQQFNDYLEEIEMIVFNLCNNIEIIETNKRIEQYKRENRDTILRNKKRLGREEYELEELLEMERLREEERRHELIDREMAQKKQKALDKEELIDRLAAGGKSVTSILDEYIEKIDKLKEEERKLPPLKAADHFSTGIKIARAGDQTFLPVSKLEEGPLYEHKDLVVETEGPVPPTVAAIEQGGFMVHIRGEGVIERAGGYKATMACQRALQEAMQGLYQGYTM